MKKLVVTALLTLGMSAFTGTTALAQGDAAAGEGKITICLACHGTSGNDSLLPDVPKIGGQNESYLLKQMQDIKNGTRGAPLTNAQKMLRLRSPLLDALMPENLVL